jgi:hypothetical protein
MQFFFLKKEMLLNYRPNFRVSISERKHKEIYELLIKCLY